jgi:hypothetical protein
VNKVAFFYPESGVRSQCCRRLLLSLPLRAPSVPGTVSKHPAPAGPPESRRLTTTTHADAPPRHRSYQSRAIRTLLLLEGVLASGIGQDRLTAAGNGKRMCANPSERRVGRDPMSRARRIADHLRSTFRACRRPAALAAHVGSLSSGRCAGIEGQSLSVCTCSAACSDF